MSQVWRPAGTPWPTHRAKARGRAARHRAHTQKARRERTDLAAAQPNPREQLL